MKKKSIITLIIATLTITSCQESLNEKCARECQLYTQKNCPAQIDNHTIIDSLTFDPQSRTIHYYYTLTGIADREGVMEEINGLQILKDNLKNSTAMKVYKENHYNFTYTYRSEKDPKKILMEVTLTDKDY